MCARAVTLLEKLDIHFPVLLSQRTVCLVLDRNFLAIDLSLGFFKLVPEQLCLRFDFCLCVCDWAERVVYSSSKGHRCACGAEVHVGYQIPSGE